MSYRKFFLRSAPILLGAAALTLSAFYYAPKEWESKFVHINADGTISYTADEKGNTIPDFSRVGYFGGDKAIPDVAVVKTISADGDNSQQVIQAAIDEVAARTPDANGFRGAILLKKGTYKIGGAITVKTSGIVLRGEGDDTRLIATGTTQRSLINISGSGSIKEAGAHIKITDDYVPVGTFSFNIASANGFKVGDNVILYRPGTDQWVSDLKMDQIVERKGTKQWTAKEYNLSYERVITKIEGNKVYLNEPVVLAMEPKYGGGELFKYTFPGRIAQVGVENLYCESEYTSDTAENHGWTAVEFDKAENGWVRNVTAKYFGYSCVHLNDDAKFFTITDCKYLDGKSVITGGRRYSFNNDGQLNLVMNCYSTDARHDFVTGARVKGPNVFFNCSAKRTHADIGPHHRWATGTLYDNIKTDGEINVQDRGYMGSGHGWAGVNQVLWNCDVKAAAVQAPWVSGNNFSIGTQGEKKEGSFKGRNEGIWEGQNKKGLTPASLYLAQLKARKGK
ncbi:MAG: hypothetical protein J0I41_14360 [Filimonas sp.]|nr:hypothetical protein [Filimonas sp.]